MILALTLVSLVVVMLSVVAVTLAVRRAADGYEDHRGFHGNRNANP